jgi:hypothetical protein
VRARRRRVWAALLLPALAVLLAPPGEAGAPLQVQLQPGVSSVAAVVLQGIPVLRLRGPDAPGRAAEVARRLQAVLAARPSTVTVTLRPGPGGTTVLLNEQRIVTADRGQALLNWTTPEALAVRWAEGLRLALARNTVILTPDLLRLSPGQAATVAVASFLAGAVTLGPFDERVVAARAVGGTVVVEARAVGSTVIPVIVGGGGARLPVVVRREAGTIPPAVTVRVTGDLASPLVIHEAVQRRLDQAVTREPGATVTIGPLPPLEGSESSPLELTVPVRIRSTYLLPVEGFVRVTVVQESVAVADPALLLVSNRPEVVDADGILFAETVDARHPIRLLYHHMNGTREHSRILSVVLSNRSTRPAEMLLISGLAGPSPDPLFTGHAATTRFLQNLSAGRGYVLEIAPHSRYAFTAQTMLPRQLVSGILQLQLLQGEELEVRVQIRLPWLLEGTVALPVNQIAYPHPKGIFQSPTVILERTVDVRWPAPLVDLGAAAGLADLRTGERLVGDYGVVYRILITAANLAGREVQADLVATAAGGPARGTFLIDGRLVEMAIFRPNEERVLATTAVIPPGEWTQLQVVTMPTAGSYYPVRLMMRARE